MSKYLPVKEARRFDSFLHFGMAAAMEAIDDAGLQATPANAERIGVNIGSGIGGLPMIEERTRHCSKPDRAASRRSSFPGRSST